MTTQRIQIAVGILTLIVGGYLYAGTLREETPPPVTDAPLGGVANGKPLFDEVGTQVYTDCNLRAPKRQNIENDLKNLKAKNQDNSLRALEAKERASLKGCEIAKIKTVAKQRVQFSGADYEIEIVEMNPIEGGVEVFARAWTPDGQQIGFGKDGTVDIERFRIINPPILVEDLLGTIVRDETNALTGERVVRKLREDSLGAILQSLAHTISVKEQKFTGTKIEAGKRGNTTTTVYPDANPETTSVDGYAGNNTPASWATIRSATGNFQDDAGAVVGTGWDTSGGSTYSYMSNGFILFDTSAIGDTDTIDSATFSGYGQTKANTGGNSPAYNIYGSTPASNTAIASTDYQNVGTTAFSTAIATASFSTSAYNNWALNASGLSAISKTGVTKFSFQEANYYRPNTPPATPNVIYAQFKSADTAGTASDPKLVIESTASAPVGATPGDIIPFN